MRVLAMPTKHLVQTTVEKKILRALDSLARSSGHKRAGYLRHLIELHVKAIKPKLLVSLSKTRPDELLTPRKSRGR